MELKKLPLDLDDLRPQESTFVLDLLPGKTLVLRHWSLIVKNWALKRFGGAVDVQIIFAEQRIDEIAELCFFMLKPESKLHFVDGSGEPTLEKFFDSICSIKDQITIQKALLKTIGIGEPEFKKLEDKIAAKGEQEKADPKPKRPKSSKRKIGAKSSIRSQAAMRGARPKGS